MINAMDRAIQIKAMASETRMAILRLLARPSENFEKQWSADPAQFGVCMTLIAEALSVAQPTASRHLDILKQARFITVKRHQKWSYCQRNEDEITKYLVWLEQELVCKKMCSLA